MLITSYQKEIGKSVLFQFQWKFLVFTLGILLSTIPNKVWAQASNLPKLPGIDLLDEHRHLIDPTQYPWQIIGRVQTELGEKCTGFLIDSRVAVTAAHCLWLNKTRNFVQPTSIHFLLQYHQEKFVTDVRVKRFIISPSYNPLRDYRKTYLNAGVDRAYLLLDRPVTPKGGFLPIVKELPLVGTPIMLGGYEQDRMEVLYADQSCSINAYSQDYSNNYILLHNCQATYGSSGAPILAKDDQGKWSIIGMQVAAHFERPGGLGATVATFGQKSSK